MHRSRMPRAESRFRKSAQGDKWSFCLTACTRLSRQLHLQGPQNVPLQRLLAPVYGHIGKHLRQPQNGDPRLLIGNRHFSWWRKGSQRIAGKPRSKLQLQKRLRARDEAPSCKCKGRHAYGRSVDHRAGSSTRGSIGRSRIGARRLRQTFGPGHR
jgi:hypothetical protein